MLRWIALALCSVGLIACGGGGGGRGGQNPGGNQPPPQPQPQSISFSQAGPVYKLLGDVSYANVATGGSGTGAVTYSSDTPAVATVDASSGAITMVGLGSAQITANKAADANYTAAQASYTLRIGPRTVNMTAWIGESDAEITFASEAAALDFTRSSDPQCDPSLYALCNHGIQSTITTTNVVDSTATLARPAIYWMKYGPYTTHGVMAPDMRTEPIYSHPNLVTFNDKLWLMTGFGYARAQLYSSVDGINWRLENDNVPVMEGSRLLVFKNALWVVGSRDNSWIAEVWMSADGKTWSEVPQSLRRTGHMFAAATVHNGRMWITGGNSGGDEVNDVWSSEDGSTWTQATSAAPFSPRMHHELTSFAGRLWITGGWHYGVRSDIWSSADGASWTQETTSPAFGPRFGHRIVTNGDTMWLIGGQDGYQSEQRDVWTSTDGRSWTLVTASAEFPRVSYHAAVLWNGMFWMQAGSGHVLWSSPSGEHWTKRTVAAVIPGTSAATAAGFKGRLFVIDEEFRVWSSADGFAWNKEMHEAPTATTSLGAGGMQLLTQGDRLLLMGGLKWLNPAYVRELWSSTDGRNWSKLIDALPVRADSYMQLLQLNGQLWLFGSPSTDAYAVEVWSSTDGVAWTRVAASPAFAPRFAYKALAYDGRLWIVGGSIPLSNPQDDVWFSTDGATWTRVDAPTGLPANNFQDSLAFSTGMCVYGLSPSGPSQPAFCSTDGRSWQKKSDDVPFGGPRAVLDGNIYAIGRTGLRWSPSDQVWKSTDGYTWRLGYQNTLRFP